MLLNIFALIALIYICINCYTNTFNIFFFKLFITIFTLNIIVDSLLNIRKNTKNITDILSILILVIMNLIFIRAFFEPNFSSLFNYEYYRYIEQNFGYFFIMLLTMEIQKYINKKTA